MHFFHLIPFEKFIRTVAKDGRKLSTKSIQRKYQNEMTNKNTIYLPNIN
jgi:hypothetical protein